MSSITLTAGGLEWRYWPEPAPSFAARSQIVASAQLIDELTGEPPRVPVRATTNIVGLAAKASAGGLVGVSGRPAALYPNPWPGVATRVAFTVAADGYMPIDFAGNLPPQPSFPADFAPLDFGAVELHRAPTRISGRAVDAAGATVAGATVTITAIWPTVDAILAAGAAPNSLALMTGLYTDRPAGATMRRRTLGLLAAPKTLVELASAGTTRIKLSDRQALIVNRPLAFEPGDPERAEYVPIAAIDTSSSADQPAWITLHHPLARARAARSPVSRTSFNAPGAANLLTRAGRRGDTTVLTAGLAGFAPGQPTLEITGGGAPDEYHGFQLWRAVTGADGRYRLPPLHRLAHVEIIASGGGQPLPAVRVVSLAGEADMIADLVFP